jgi:iron complex outermembrane receptor protein
MTILYPVNASRQSQGRRMRSAWLAGATLVPAAIACLGLSCAQAQAAGDDQSSETVETVVVTGTLIRGVAPVGASVVKLSTEDIQIRGTASTVDLLAQVPEISQFGTLPTSGGNAASIVVPPTIRGLPTLVLFNGYRAASTGVVQQVADVSIIPPSLLERVEVIPGSGSALYGSDAVGGVINFITRNHVDGLEFNAHGGVGDNYSLWSADAAYGYDWRGGSLVVGYQYSWNCRLKGSDRDWFTIDPRNLGTVGPLVETCESGNLVAGGVNYRLSDMKAGTSSCDTYKMTDIYPTQSRHNVYASVHQDITSNLSFDIVSYYSRLEQKSQGLSSFGLTNVEATETITSANPYFQAVGSETSQTISMSLGSAARALGYRTGLNDNRLEQFGITPKLTYMFGGDWRAVLSFNYGRTSNNTYSGMVNSTDLATAFAGTTTATAFNPYDPLNTDSDVLKSIFDYAALGRSHQQLDEVRLVADGSLFALPGGNVKMAVGYEHHEDSVVAALGNTPDDPLPQSQGDRKVESVYAEFMVPVVGSGNARPWVQSIDLSLSGRFDHYSDVGDTFNPKVGLSYNPISDLKIQGNWGKSFHAPALTDTIASVSSSANVLLFSPFYRSKDLAYFLHPEIFITGGNDDLKPEKSQSWSIGADLTPSNIPGLNINTTYFVVNFKDQISIPPITDLDSAAAQPYVVFFPTLAQLQEAMAGMTTNYPNVASFYTSGNEPYALIYARYANLAKVDVSGLDFSANYTVPTSFGSMHVGVAGNYYLTYKSQSNSVSVFVNNLESSVPRVRVQVSTGFAAGDLSGEIRLDYLGGHSVQGNIYQTRVEAYTPVSLYLAYNLPDIDAFKNTHLTLNVDNLFGEDPPWSTTAPGVSFTNIGRVVKLGLHTAL